MSIELHRCIRVATGRSGVIGRRDFLRGISAAGLAAGTLNWADLMTARADELRRRGMACILLWMSGGPSQFETFSPRPDHPNGGSTKAIPTAVPGIEIADGYPQLARAMKDVAIIRSMTSKEGSHPRATFLMHTGYVPSASVKYPSLGGLVAHEIGDPKSDLPSFVRIGNGARAGGDGGFLGVECDPFSMNNAGQTPNNATLTTDVERYHRRMDLLNRLETDFGATARDEVADHRKQYERASRMILSPSMKAFDLGQETDAMRTAYGQTQFGNGCLLARRLIESGVTFIEIDLNGWDTHLDNFNKTKELAGQIDGPMAQLIADLKQRGRLDSTLILWMGEFGRTPTINPRGGRDHWPSQGVQRPAGGRRNPRRASDRPDGQIGNRNRFAARDDPRSVPDRLQIAEDRPGQREHEPDRPADQDRRRRGAGERTVRVDPLMGSSIAALLHTRRSPRCSRDSSCGPPGGSGCGALARGAVPIAKRATLAIRCRRPARLPAGIGRTCRPARPSS